MAFTESFVDFKSSSNSFSMAKSYVNALLGKAIMDGYIKSLDQPVSDFFKEFKTGKAAKLTVGDLSSMSSGLNFVEEYYSPFSITAKSYFTSDLESLILGLKVVDIPGEKWKYLSSDTQLLGMVIKKASGQTLSNYLSNSFWKPMGSKNSAKWQIDSNENNLEKAFCCIASNARDFARIGKLYKQYGKWNGEVLLDSSFVAKSIKPRFKDSKQYGFGWWLANYNDKEITISAGNTTAYIPLTILDDDFDEYDQILRVKLSLANSSTWTNDPTDPTYDSFSGAAGAEASVGANDIYTFTIRDNDAEPYIQFEADAAKNETNSGSRSKKIAITATS